MGHLTTKNYLKLYRRMDQFPAALYPSKNAYEILKVLFSDEEAELCSLMPLLPFSLKDISKVWRKSEEESRTILYALGKKGLVYVSPSSEGEEQIFGLNIPVLGFFEFSLMRTDGKFDRKVLSELYHQYINMDDGFVKKYSDIDPPIARVFAFEDEIRDVRSEVLPYEKATNVIDTASAITVGTCFCRHKMEHMGKACDNPQDVCLTFNGIAKYLAEQGIAREISKEEAHRILDLCVEKGLVQIGDNVKSELLIICNCCGCCCDLLLAYKKPGRKSILSPSNFIARIDREKCDRCGACVKKCPVDAITENSGDLEVNSEVCLGCGVCARSCRTKACKLESRPVRAIIPYDFVERAALWAIYKGKIGNFMFDDQRSVLHKVMRKLLNTFTGFPPVKMMLLNRRINRKLIGWALGAKKFQGIKDRPAD